MPSPQSPLRESIERSRQTTKWLGRAASVLLAASAVLTAIAGLWWRTTYLLAIAVIVWIVLGRNREPRRGSRGRPPATRR
ncbi:MAG TPA: hypothetical protein VIQ60_00225 [Gemmatimonadaceae bacterium]